MEYIKLGTSDLNVSRICLGCMGFGNPQTGQHTWTVGEDDTRAIVKRALDAGINFFDTAIAYQNGTSEEYLGRALRDFSRRDDVVVATKFLPRTADEIADGVTGQQHIANSIDTSLTHLGMDHVDLYIYHMWDYNTPLHDIMEGLSQVVASGKARYIGIANVYAWQLEKANALAEREGFPKFVSVQNHMNLIFREDEREVAPCCAEEGIALTPYSALASGRLSRRPGETSTRLEQDSYAKFKYDATAEADARVIERVAEVADSHGVSMTEVSLAWLLTKVASPIAGATKLHHVDGAAAAVDLKLSADEVAYLEEPYVPHAIVGVMAQNKPADAGKEHVWLTNAKYLKEEQQR
ncbi:putative aldo-keto reductase [Slackia heliotrinireducens]|uniref:Predicted oxidoreductase, aryl-alcohol dehydrogenase like protein n=1 Tax=Slackia heliotrinireducens (strain ATCC 29202 / DSM 20476 / NCTC 11029 / RHS 1) TaxID=471855 RepID=C7N7F3_SLAHD|nr:aldo/keto reductase [Slackia heliotrinireducens]ACV22838.1 predicted oxidoreductase, aryl-alcohol dehydrogenase like protein [Slackia heliotrinireducens DSM 20476]VEH01577.1 putative aldo-keto reductase [Slackia heliotrinireducens]